MQQFPKLFYGWLDLFAYLRVSKFSFVVGSHAGFYDPFLNGREAYSMKSVSINSIPD
jgi:hypothetical protein